MDTPPTVPPGVAVNPGGSQEQSKPLSPLAIGTTAYGLGGIGYGAGGSIGMIPAIGASAFAAGSVAHTDFVHERPVHRLDSLMRGEIAAVETYQQAIDSIRRHPAAAARVDLDTLRAISDQHTHAVKALHIHIKALGGVPSDGAGPWGAWAKFVQATADLFGADTAIKSLKEGEEHGRKEYQQALDSDDLDDASVQWIREQVLPTIDMHVQALSRMIESTDSRPV